jgi:hypothetical protein
MEDDYPFTDFYAYYPSCQHVLKWIYDNNDGGIAKQNIMTEPLNSMDCCQHKFFDMKIIEFRSYEASTQLIDDIF